MAGQLWSVSARGGTLTQTQLSKKLRHAAQPLMVFRQFTMVETDFGKNEGDTLQFKKVGNVATRGRVISETEKVPETFITFTSDQVQAFEYSNSITYTWTVELLAVLDIRSAIVEALKNDMAIVLDIAASLEFKKTDLKYIPTGTETNKSYTLDTNGTPSIAATRKASVWDHKNIVDLMKATYRMPKYDGKNYHSIATTAALRGLMDDSEWIEAAKYGDPSRLFDGEVGRLYSCRFTEESNALDNSMTGDLGEMVYFGKDVCIEISAYPEELQAKLGGDYGRDRGIRWVWVGGYKHVWDFSTEGEARAIHVTSNA